jgi:all-trans-retinol 13,14-reductase
MFIIFIILVIYLLFKRYRLLERNMRFPKRLKRVSHVDTKTKFCNRSKNTEPNRDRYNIKKVPEKVDAIVVGSGISSLTTASLLARCGYKVLVLEQHYIAGGCTHCFNDKGFEFDTGVHYIGNMERRKELLDLITDKKIEWDELGGERLVYDEIYIEGEKFEFRSGKQNFIDDLVRRFPKEKNNIKKYVDLVERVSDKSLFFKLKTVRPRWLAKIIGIIFCGEFY